VPDPQPVLAPLTPAAIFLVVTVDDGGEPTVRDALADISGLVRAVGFRDPAKHLSVITSIGSQAWDRLSCTRSSHSTARDTPRQARRAICCSMSEPRRWTSASSWPTAFCNRSPER
jgi:deferrochelatase/peroxidase EfeB